MTEPNKEQIREFWEWCEFKLQPNVISLGTIDWPDYVWHDSEGNPRPDEGLPPIDLNNLFKYAVPKLKHYELNNYWGEGKHTGWAGIEGGSYHFGRDETPKLALFWAIWKVIKGGNDEPRS